MSLTGLKLVGWDGNPAFTADAFAALHHHSGGVPRRLNTLASRVLLQAGLEELTTIAAATIDDVAGDMAADAPPATARSPEPAAEPDQTDPVLPFEENLAANDSASLAPAGDGHVQRRITALEERLEEQEVALRRVLTLLVDWIERDEQARLPLAEGPAEDRVAEFSRSSAA